MDERNNLNRFNDGNINRRNLRINPDEILLKQKRSEADRRARQQNRQPQNAQKTQKKRRKKRFSILKIIFATLLIVILLATGALSAGVAWYVVKLSEDLPSMVELANPKSSLTAKSLRGYLSKTEHRLNFIKFRRS